MTNSTAFELSVDKSMLNHLSTVPVSTEFKITLDLSLIGWDLSLIKSVKDSISSIWLLTEALSTEVSFLTAVQNQPDLLYLDTIRLWTLARTCAWGTIKGQEEQEIIHVKADTAAVISQETIEAFQAEYTQQAETIQILCALNSTDSASRCSALYKDLKPFKGDKADLKGFQFYLQDLNHKMKANADWWTTEKKHILYILFTLNQNDTVKKQFCSYMNTQSNLICCDTTEMLRIMTVSFEDINKDERNTVNLLKLHQGLNCLPEFLPEWLALASTSDYNDTAKINTLKAALHSAIIEHLSYYDKALISSTINSYIIKVYEIDTLLHSIKGENYTKLSAWKFTQLIQSSLFLIISSFIPSTFTDINGDTTMNLSLI